MNESVAPVYIIVNDPGSGGHAWLTALFIAAASLLAIAAIAAWVKWRCQRNPLDSAFLTMARALALPRRERDDLRALAEKCGIPAAVLLVSESARNSAALRRARAVLGRVV
jgi:hypothetical protein